jgi:hypothetical protein
MLPVNLPQDANSASSAAPQRSVEDTNPLLVEMASEPKSNLDPFWVEFFITLEKIGITFDDAATELRTSMASILSNARGRR